MESKKPEECVLLATGKRVPVSKERAEIPEGEEEAPVIERVYNVWGSSSGARSNFFDIYCKTRSTETERLEAMEKQWKEDMENKVFQTIRYNRMMKEKEKQIKRRDKRLRKKQKDKVVRRQSQVSDQHLTETTDNQARIIATRIGVPENTTKGADLGTESIASTVDNNTGPTQDLDQGRIAAYDNKVIIDDDLMDSF